MSLPFADSGLKALQNDILAKDFDSFERHLKDASKSGLLTEADISTLGTWIERNRTPQMLFDEWKNELQHALSKICGTTVQQVSSVCIH